MKINKLTTNQKIIIIVSGFILVIILISLFFIRSNNIYGDEININNYDKHIPNLPVDRKNAIDSSLYNIIKDNLKSDDLSINDATIRENSAEYNYDESTNINSGSFIVDIPSIKQSYFISYEWSSDANNKYFSGYTALATCLTSDKLIYSDFDCKDNFSNIESRDPILDHLPYSTFNYTITANTNNSSKVDLDVNIILYFLDTRDNNSENSINIYKAEVIDWIKSKNIDPSLYIINYIIKSYND